MTRSTCRRVAAGEVEVPELVMAELPAETRAAAAAAAASKPASAVATADRPSASEAAETAAHGRTSALIFLAGVAFIVVMGLFESLRPTVGSGAEAGPLSMTIVIELTMFTVALVILLAGKIAPAKVLEQPLLSAGIVAAIALFGIAWMADTFIAGNPQIIDWMGSVVKDHPLFLAVALFLVCGLTTSQSATTRTLIPIASRRWHVAGDHHRDVAVPGRGMAIPGQRPADRRGRHRQDRDDQAQPGPDLALVHHPDAGVVGERGRGRPGHRRVRELTDALIPCATRSVDGPRNRYR